MTPLFESSVEQYFHTLSQNTKCTTKTPYVMVNNFPNLGLMTALRFLEWIGKNPEGVISLPTGKTPEFFIKYTQFLLENWNGPKAKKYLDVCGLSQMKKPDLRGLHFVQIDEFYPISPDQTNSFHNYVSKYYLDGFGLDRNRALLINSNDIQLAGGKHFSQIFPDSCIDLSLRYREAKTLEERQQQSSIFKIDEWCCSYEQQIRDKGGIGFFLGGIGPDGHIAFNIKGSDHFSSTRLTKVNFETQAVAAGDLGGMEISRHRLVITIGLETITHNPNVVAIIFASGEAKANIVKQSLEHSPGVLYPATALQKCSNSRFFLTIGAAKQLEDQVERFYEEGDWSELKTQKSVIDLSKKLAKYVHHLTLEDLQNDKYCKQIPNLSLDTTTAVATAIKEKLFRGMKTENNQVIYHTGPHHDDIMLGLMPYTNRQVRLPSNEMHFSVLTSGFNAITNQNVIDDLCDILSFIEQDRIQMIHYANFFTEGYTLNKDKDVFHFLDAVAEQKSDEQRRGVSHRLIRAIVEVYDVANKQELVAKVEEIIIELENSYAGSVNSPKIQKLKGMIREFEEELVWAHYGVPVRNIHHLRLGFYKGEVFTEQPQMQRDIEPVLEEFRKYKPTMISLVMDPEGSGPDTHYKVLQTIAGAVKEWSKEEDLSDLKILGYRNVWFRYHPAEVNMIIPVSLNALDVLKNSFEASYRSQVHASFPSFEYDGTFSDLAQKIWVEQMRQIQLVLGKGFFFENEMPLLRATHGMIYAQMLDVNAFLDIAQQLERTVEGIAEFNAS